MLCHHNVMVGVVNGALGGEKEKAPPQPGEAGVRDLTAGHSTVEGAIAAINAAFTI